jgi:anti-sigma B factor antagonist
MAELEPAASASAAVEAREENGTLVLYLSGDLDVTNAEEVRSAVNAAMSGHAERVIFDLADLDFMDSSGIALLVSVAGQVRDVQVRNPSAIVRRLIELTGLTGTWRIGP